MMMLLITLWCWEVLGAGGEGDNRGWDGWMASLTRWMWVWVNSGSWWWTGRPGVLRFMGSQGVGYNWATELNWTEGPLWWMCTHLSVKIDSSVKVPGRLVGHIMDWLPLPPLNPKDLLCACVAGKFPWPQEWEKCGCFVFHFVNQSLMLLLVSWGVSKGPVVPA